MTSIKRYTDDRQANQEKHTLGEVWFVKTPFNSGLNWYVQFASGRNAFTTKAAAVRWSKVFVK